MFVATKLLVYDVLLEGCGMLLRETSLAHESPPDESLGESLDGSLKRMPMRMQATWITLAASRGVASV